MIFCWCQSRIEASDLLMDLQAVAKRGRVGCTLRVVI
jgi:hypothetical protein